MIPDSPKILCLGAHPDDIELGCSGTLMRCFRHAQKYFIIAALCIEQGIDQPNAEAERSAKLFGNTQLMQCNYRNSFVHEQLHDLITRIDSVITSFEPDIIFTHTPDDHHQDHRAVYEATIASLRRFHGLAVGYLTWSWISQQFDVIVEIDQERKNTVMQTFVSQKNRLASFGDSVCISGQEKFKVIKWML